MTDGAGLDFTDTGMDVGIDKSGDSLGTGPGNSINQTSSVFLAQDTDNGNSTTLPSGVYTFFELNGGTSVNMYGVVAAPLLGDSDGDGMPDDFEISNGLNPYFDDSNMDADADGLTNLLELQRGTGVNDSDSDNDGLLDGVETNTGVFVRA